MTSDLPAWAARSGPTIIGIAIILGYPALVVAALEIARGLKPRREFTSSIMREIAYLVLPAGAIWLILRVLVELPAEDWAVRTAETLFALTALHVLLRLGQAVLMALIDDQARAPKLLLDILRIGLSVVWAAIIVSNIWHVDLGSLFAAVGVGSIVLGFALQEFLGNLLSGLGLLSAHEFGIGDWIVVDGGPAKVVGMDWRTVTLIKTDGNRIVVANSTLAKGNLVISARSNDVSFISVALTLSATIPPERVRDAALEAAAGMPSLPGAPAAKCLVTGLSGASNDFLSYAVVLPVANPGVLAGPRDEFLSRFWYVAQRHGLRLGAAGTADATASDADARLRLMSATGAFHGEADIMPDLARASAFRRYRRGDLLLNAGATTDEALLVLTGSLAVLVAAGETDVRLELVGTGQLLVLHETLAGGASPVRVLSNEDADVLAIPAAVLHAVMERSRAVARDVSALAEARRLAIQPYSRNLRAVA